MKNKERRVPRVAETVGRGTSRGHYENEIYDLTGKKSAFRGVYPFLAARSMPLNGLTPSRYLYRDTQHPRTPRARADVALGRP